MLFFISFAHAGINPLVAVVNETIYDTTPDLATNQWVQANAYYANGTTVGMADCVLSIYRWSANNSMFIPTYSYTSNPEAIDHPDTTGMTYILQTDGAGTVRARYHVDPMVFYANDVGHLDITCGNATADGNFTIANFREPSGITGEILSYLIENPSFIFSLFILFLLATCLLVVTIVLPIIIIRNFWR